MCKAVWKPFLYILIVLVLAVTATSLSAQDRLRKFTEHPRGTMVYALSDSVSIVQAGKDTSDAFFVGGCDQWSYQAVYKSRNDSINIKLQIDLSADGITWKAWRSAAYDSCLISGTADIDTIGIIANPPNYMKYARSRIIGAAAAADTVDVTSIWVCNWLVQALTNR